MSHPHRATFQIANIVLTALLFIAVVASIVMKDTPLRLDPQQSVTTATSTGAKVQTFRVRDESLEAWGERHAAALAEFDQ